MKVPISDDIAAVLQNPRSARELVNAVLNARNVNPTDPIVTVRIGDKVKRYKSVSALYRKPAF